jgi:hypothetical protein
MRNGRRRLHITNVEAKLGRLKRLLLALLATGAGVAITIVGPAGLANAGHPDDAKQLLGLDAAG